MYLSLKILRSISVSPQSARRIPPFLYLLFCLTGHSVFSAEEELSRLRRSTEYTRQVNLYVQELENLERRFGPYDRSLLEPLDALISLHSSVDDFEEINSLLGRQLQLVHVTEGSQRFQPIINFRITYQGQSRNKNFESVTNNLEIGSMFFCRTLTLQWNKSSLPWMILEIGI